MVGWNVSEVDRDFASVCLRLYTERRNGRETLPTYEVTPGQWMTVAIFADDSGPDLSHLRAEVVR